MSPVKSYPSYVASGEAWLGDIPPAWKVQPARTVFRERKAPSTPEDEHLTPSQSFGVLPQSEYMRMTGNRVVLNLTGADNMRHVKPRDFISHLRSFQGGLEYSTLEGKVSAAYTVLRPVAEVHDSYFRYLFKSSRYVEALQTTTDQLRDGQSIRFAQFALLPLPMPSLEEQVDIANYLDRETAEIDAFIADQEKLIELLTERRAATIEARVTNGLKANAERMVSHVDWIGLIPAHWQVRKLSQLFGVIGSGTTPPRVDPDPYGGDVAWVTTSELREKEILSTRQTITDDALSRFSALQVYAPGTVLIAMYGATIGRLGTLGIAAATNQACCAFSNPRGVASRYAYYALWAARRHLLNIADGGGQPNLNQEKLRQLRVPVPPLAEQSEIAVSLDRETAEIDATIADAREAIALSKERRSALISAAVTGKIDVREHGKVIA